MRLAALLCALIGFKFAKPQAVHEAAFDVIIVGAGTAGVQVASQLSEGELNVLVLESESYAGGRLRSMHMDGVAVPMGAGWVHGTNTAPDGSRNPLLDLIRDNTNATLLHTNYSAVDVYYKGKKVLPEATTDMMNHVGALTDALSCTDLNQIAWRIPFSRAFFDILQAGYGITDEVLMALFNYSLWEIVDYQSGRTPQEVSTCEVTRCGVDDTQAHWGSPAQDSLVIGRYEDILSHKVHALGSRIKYEHRVSSISRSGDAYGMRVTATSNTGDVLVLSAKHVVVTAHPLAVKRTVSFNGIPTETTQFKVIDAFASRGSAHYAKLWLRFEEAFWLPNSAYIVATTRSGSNLLISTHS
ncbi:MAG: hypothetical protein MHM6MM_000716 [Cercozoa sp. M6MM]